MKSRAIQKGKNQSHEGMQQKKTVEKTGRRRRRRREKRGRWKKEERAWQNWSGRSDPMEQIGSIDGLNEQQGMMEDGEMRMGYEMRDGDGTEKILANQLRTNHFLELANYI